MPKKKPITEPIAHEKATPKKLRIKKKLPKKLPYKGWNPLTDGISQSLLQKFITDRDRFHIHAVRGKRETDRKEAMEFGSIFHKMAEIGSEMKSRFTKSKMDRAVEQYMRVAYPSEESMKLARIALVTYYGYRKWQEDRPKYKFIDAEPVFAEKHTLPPITFNVADCISLRVPRNTDITLRGRIDGVLEIDNEMWIEEYKTKGQINIAMLSDTIPENIQVMIYAVCSQIKYNRPCAGVIYNIIRKCALKQRQKESELDFLQRVREDIEDNPAFYFYRLAYKFQRGAIAKWIKEELNPILYQLYFWWRSIEANPLDPWQSLEGIENPFHGRKPFGIYDSLSQGKGDFFDLIVYGRTGGLRDEVQMFPELQDDPEIDIS